MIPLNQNLNALRRSDIRAFTNLARQTPGCHLLTIGEPDFDTPAEIKAAAVAALNRNETHYAPNQGTAALRQAVAQLEPRERQIMEMRYGLRSGREQTQKEVADAIGISQSYISRLEKRIIRDLRRRLEQEN